MRPLLLACFAVSLAITQTAVVQSAAAEDRQIPGTISGTTITLVVPAAFCPLDPSNPSDANMLKVVRQAQAGKNYVVTQFANCAQLQAWRSGQRKVLDDLGGATTPIQYAGQVLPYTRAQLVTLLAQTYRRQGGALLKGATDDVNRNIGSAAKNMKINETKFLGVLAEDKDAVYVGLLQSLRTELGDTKVQIGVTAVTLIKGKMISIAVYTPAVSENSSTEALATARAIVAKTIAANGG